MMNLKQFEMYEKSYIKGKMIRLRKANHSLQSNYETDILENEIELLKKNAIPYLNYILSNIDEIDYNNVNNQQLNYISNLVIQIESFIKFLNEVCDLTNHTQKIIDYIYIIDMYFKNLFDSIE